MYTVGSLFYAIYFFVSFPVFFFMDEQPRSRCSIRRPVADSLASGMAVTILLDLWRLLVSGRHKGGDSPSQLVWTAGSH